ncbi:MAG: HNH endonuclease [Anaerolineales bacterium]|nr:HNH endonuclease [Anaerolineales bacterium]
MRALEEAGASAFLVSRADRNPRRLMVQSGNSAFELWAYIWTITHGGYPRSPDEYRIQMTGVTPPLQLNPSGLTVLIGYEPNSGTFAGFDILKHLTFRPGSSSIQILRSKLLAAQQDGFSFAAKDNDEIAVGIKSDQLLAYVMNAQALHEQGADAATVGVLSKVVAFHPIPESEIQQLPTERQLVVGQVRRLTRDADFRRKVTLAYDRRCAVTRYQLRLVDAAHILPVGAPGSNDEVQNGLCLSPTIHRAYDRGLIYLDEELVVRINPAQEAELARMHLDGGITEFKRKLGTKIHLPADRRQWSDLGMIRRANTFRKIAAQ